MRLHLYKRGRVWWVRGSVGGVKFRRSTRHVDKRKASLVRDRWEREIADPTHLRAHEATVGSAAARWKREIKAAMNPETVRFYDVKIRHVERVIGAVRLAHLTHDKVLSYIETREGEGAAQHSIHRELTALRLTLKSAKRAREFPGDPRDVVPRYKAGYVPRTDFVEPETIWGAIGHLLPIRGAAVAFAAATACDFSCIPLARRSGVRAGSIIVPGNKTATRTREVPRGVDPFEHFLRHAIAYAQPGEQLFPAWGSMARDVRAACRRAGVQEFTARTLRHSAATWMVRAGVPYELAAKFLGHGSTTMLQRVYGHLAPAAAGALMRERMGGVAVPAAYPDTAPKGDIAAHTDSSNTLNHDKEAGSDARDQD